MKKSLKKKLLFLVVTLCIILFLSPPNIMGARITGEDELVTTSDKKTISPKKETPKAQPVRKAVKKKTPAKAKKPVVKAKARQREEESKHVTIDFDNVDIRVFIKFISELTGKNFVIDRKVKGKVTIISPRKISVNEAYKVFESVLEVHGVTVVPAGDIVKILPSRDAREENIETRLKVGAISPEDRVITQIIPLNYANPDELKKIFTPLISKSSIVLSYPPTGMLIVTDLLSNIQRLLKIISALDVEGIGEQISVIPLQYASSPETAKSLNQIFNQNRPSKRGMISRHIKIVADERTNTIITLASENETLNIKQLIYLLDREVPKGEAKVRVYRLQYADAEELTNVLMSLPDKETPQKGKAPFLSKDIKVVPDKATNTLILTAGRDDYIVLQNVIKELDIPRPMVYIEALIMEVNVDKGLNLGVEWMGGEYISDSAGRTKVYGGGFSGGGQYPNLTDVATKGILPTGFSLGIFGETLKIGDLVFPNLGAILQAYEKDQDVHILATPQLLTLDNEEAEIYVGQNVPYQTRQETSSTDLDYSTYEYKDVGVTLKITPQISHERFVRLKIFQEVTKLVKEVGQQSDRPTTLKRTAKTTVTIKDNNTIVIGGLIGEDVTNTEYKVPCLGNIPILGWLFKYQSRSSEKRNLFIFITPHIIENPAEAKALYKEKQEHINKVEEGVIKTYKKKREKK